MNRSLRLILLLAAACGPKSPETTATDSTSDTTTAETSMSTGTGTTVEPTSAGTTDPTTTTTDATTTTTGSTGLESTTGETTGGEVCGDPDPEAVKAEWWIEFPNGGQKPNISAECTVTAVDQPAPESAKLTLACNDGDDFVVDLNYTHTPVRPPPLFVDAKVLLEYREEPVFWLNRWFSIHDAGNPALMQFAGIGADHIEPPDMTVEQFYFVDLSVLAGMCSSTRTPCGGQERLALDVPFLGTPHTVFDGQFRTMVDLSGDYDIWLEQATRLDPLDCDDAPQQWFQALMAANFGP